MSAILVLGLRILLAASLYAFLGWGLYTVWRELRRQSVDLSEKQVPPISLSYQVGENVQIRHFAAPEIIIGRDPGCDCPVPDETVSARHARLTYHHNQWWIEDLQSTNGTTLNEERLYTPTVIISGDELSCGHIIFTVGMS